MYKLLKIQEDIGIVKKNAINPFLKNKYVSLESLLIQINPALKKNKVQLFQPLTNVNGRPAITTMLIEDTGVTGGIVFKDTITLPDLQDSQKMGGAITYFRRYSILSMLGIPVEDDDGNLASNTVKVKAKVKEIEKEEDPF
jgi:hypothetical protein